MHQHQHLGLLRIFRNKELDELYLDVALRSFALSLVSLFIPIYLYTAGLGIPQVLLFLAASRAAHALLVVPSAHLAARFGFKHLMALSAPVHIAYWALVYALPASGFAWYLLAGAIVADGVHKALFFTGYHVHFVKASDHTKRGTEVGLAFVISALFHFVAPLAGGFLAAAGGFKTLFLVASLVLGMSVTPLLMTADRHRPFSLRLRGAKSGISVKEAGSYAGFGFEDAAFAVWPLMLFFGVVQSYTVVGSIAPLPYW